MDDPRSITHFVVAFAFTQLVEVPLYVKLAKIRVPAAFAASLLTHPVVWFGIHWAWGQVYLNALPRFAPDTGYWVYTIGYGLVAETFAIVVEGAYLRWLGVQHPFRVAFIVNAVSATIGALTHLATGWP